MTLLPAGEPADGLVEVEVVEPRTTRTLGLVWRRAGLERAPVRAFRETVLRVAPGLLAAPRAPAPGQGR